MADPTLSAETRRAPGHTVFRLTGTLSLAGLLTARQSLDKLLADGPGVAVDVSRLALGWQPAVEVFPAVLGAAGGWPTARLTLFGASDELRRVLRLTRVSSRVPVAADEAGAVALLARRPDRVHRHLDLPGTPVSLARARAFLHAAGLDWAEEQGLDLLLLLGNELVTNVVEHARTGCRLTVGLDPRGWWLWVRDYRVSAAPRPRPIEIDAAKGRGLHLMAQLASSWGVTEHPDGKTVWLILRTTREPARDQPGPPSTSASE